MIGAELKLKYIAEYIARGDAPSYVEKSDIQVVNQACVWPSGLDLSRVKYHNPDYIDRIKGWIRLDDILINSTGTGTLGRAAIVDSKLENPTFADGHVTIIRDFRQRFYPKFLFYALSIQQKNIIALCAEGATNQIELSRSRFGDFLVHLPPLSEQHIIADYLDRQTTKIDALIAAKQRLLELLAEKRRALITHAVTRGLDATVTLRDSGVEWLGEIPRHWDVVRLKFLIFGIEHGFSPQCYNFPAEEGGWGVLKTGCVNGGVFDPQENKALPDDIDPPTEIQVDLGDVLMSRASGSLNLIGSVALVDRLDGTNLLLSDKTFRLLVNAAICDKQFFVSVMGSFPLRQQILQAVSGAAGLANNIAQNDINELLLPLPPLSEQNEIVDFLKRSITPLDELSSHLSLTINLLQERRSALIAAAVTGKLPVVSCN